MTKNPRLNWQQYSPGVLSVIPILYVAWSDSILSPSEMKLIREKIATLDFLSPEDKEYLVRHSNPQKPPSEEVFKSWSKSLKYAAQTLSKDKTSTLVGLGLEMAKSSINYKQDELWNAEQTKASLTELEVAFGVSSQESGRVLLGYQASETDSEIFSFDPKAMAKILDGRNHDVKNEMRKLLRDPYFAHQTIETKDEYRQRTLDQLVTLAKHGYTLYAFPEKYGGFGREGEHIAVFETLAYHDLSLTVKLGVQIGLFGGAVYGLGTEYHHEKYLKDLMNMDLLGCFAMTETNHGSNVRQLETTAIYNPSSKSYTIHTPHIHAGKEYIGNALHCHKAVVFAQLILDGTSKGVHAFVVDIRDESGALMPGVTVEDCGYKMGLNGVDNGRIWFDKVTISKDRLLNRYGDVTDEGMYVSEIESDDKRFFTMLGALVTGRISVGLAGVSASKVALTIATKYALKRRQFAAKEGEPERIIMDYPSHQHRLIPLLAQNYAFGFALDDLAKDLVSDTEHKNRRNIETKAAGLKAVATWLATDTIQECREACGGKGYLSENRFTDLKADSDIFTTFEGDNTVLLQLVARGLLTHFKKGFDNGGFGSVMRYLAGQMGHFFTELNPVFTRNTDSSHLSDREFHKEAFRYREKKLLYTVSQRMRKFIGRRVDPYEAYLKCQMHLIELAKAYVERLALKSFDARINALEEGPEKKALTKMCDLYAVDRLLANKGWYLENDFMSGVKTKALRRYKAKLLQDIRPDVEAYVDAFAIPEELLGAKIVLYN